MWRGKERGKKRVKSKEGMEKPHPKALNAATTATPIQFIIIIVIMSRVVCDQYVDLVASVMGNMSKIICVDGVM